MADSKPELYGVPMIPFGLLSGFVNEKEVRITEFSEEGFRFRTAKPCLAPAAVRLAFWQMNKSSYEEVPLAVPAFSYEQNFDYFYEYTVLTDAPDYRSAVHDLLSWYGSYVNLKLSEDDSGLAMALTGYPAEQEDVHFENFAAQKKAWFEKPEQLPDFSFLNTDTPELAIELDRPELYASYLHMDFEDWISHYWTSSYLSWHPLSRLRPNRLYIGNQFCHLLFPEETTLFQLLEKAYEEGLKLTLSFSYLREFMLEPVGQLLGKINGWCLAHRTTIEIMVNDWAMEDLLQNYPQLLPIFGVLINKRRKDPRLSYKKGDSALLMENNLCADFYRKFLSDKLGIKRYEWESCGYLPDLPEGKHSLHLPFYQTNTSQYCPLYARCQMGDRGAQTLPQSCPHWCSEYAFLYPAHLHMAGRYNSLFALDTEILRSPELLAGWLNAGINRLVINLL